MKKNWLLAIGLVLVLAIVGLCGCSANNGSLGGLPSDLRVNLNSQQEGIWVSGRGEVSVIPDIATLRLGIAAQSATVAEAQTQAAEAMDRVMTALTDNGVVEKDIKTQYFSIRQVTKWDRVREEETVIGYRVTNMVIAKIRVLDYESYTLDYKVGIIINAVAEAGGDLTRIEGVGFSVDDPSAYYEEAREKAMADAKAKAEQMAELSGVTLGKPTYITEGISYPIYPRDNMYEKVEAVPAPAVETTISLGEMEISLTIQIGYAILN